MTKRETPSLSADLAVEPKPISFVEGGDLPKLEQRHLPAMKT